MNRVEARPEAGPVAKAASARRSVFGPFEIAGLIIGLIIFFLGLGMLTQAFAAPPAPAMPIALHAYLQGDNDLVANDGQGSQAERVFAELEQLGRAGVEVHAFIDPPKGDSRLERWRGGELVESLSWPETDSSDPRWLLRLLDSGSPVGALRVLSIWGHGEGWRTIPNHDAQAGTSVNYLDWAPLLVDERLDLVIFDACSMATLETLNAYAPVARAVLATQFELPIDGVDYHGLAGLALPDDRDEAVLELARRLRADSREAQRSADGWYAPLVTYRLGAFAEFRAVFNRVLRESLTALGAEAPRPTPGCCGAPAVPEWSGSVDLRAYAHQIGSDWEKELVDSYTRLLSDRGYGSVQFFLPELFTDELKQPAEQAWSRDLGNWDLVRENLLKGNVR